MSWIHGNFFVHSRRSFSSQKHYVHIQITSCYIINAQLSVTIRSFNNLKVAQKKKLVKWYYRFHTCKYVFNSGYTYLYEDGNIIFCVPYHFPRILKALNSYVVRACSIVKYIWWTWGNISPFKYKILLKEKWLSSHQFDRIF